MASKTSSCYVRNVQSGRLVVAFKSGRFQSTKDKKEAAVFTDKEAAEFCGRHGAQFEPVEAN